MAKAFDRTKARAWALARGFSPGVVNRCIPNLPPQASDTAKAVMAGFRTMFEVTEFEYTRAGGTV